MADHVDTIAERIKNIEAEARERCAVDLTVDGFYNNVLKGCYVKCLEFAGFARTLSPESHSFFIAPALRGVCEDYIALRYLQARKALPERNELLKSKMLALVNEAALKQAVFFEKRRPFQPVFVWTGSAPIKASLPPTKNMAKEVGLEDLYDFMYAVTSDVVHFNPRVIIRNAWGRTKERFDHSVQNFEIYYADFCQTYGLFFLCEFTRSFAEELFLSDGYRKEVAEIERELNDKLRWPEAVTFEEMNLKDPGTVLRVLLKSGAKGGGKDA